jgi:very-short-patch-repair endonuclease
VSCAQIAGSVPGVERACNLGPNNSDQRRTHADAALARLAADQHGVVGVAQLRHLGLTKQDVSYRVAVGRLHPVLRGVYAIGHPQIGQRGWFAAALLAIGAEAVLSHRAAAAVWGFRRWDGGRIDITTSRRVRRRDHLQLHSSLVEQEDHTRKDGLRLTTPARTLLDLSPTLTDTALANLVGQAEHARLVSVPTLQRDLDRWGPRPGAKRLAKVIANGPTPTRSVLEVLFLLFLERNRLPRPQINAKVLNYRVDGLYAEQKLVIELDSHRWHDSPLAQAADRERTATLEAHGYRVMRITSDELEQRPARTAARLRAALGQRS